MKHHIKDIIFHDDKYYMQVDTINKETFTHRFTWNVIVDNTKFLISDLIISKDISQDMPYSIILESKENLSYLIGKSNKTKLYLLKNESKSKESVYKKYQLNETEATVKKKEDKALYTSDAERGKIGHSDYNKNESSITQSFLTDDDTPARKKKKWRLF